jgi:hypothetical protein
VAIAIPAAANKPSKMVRMNPSSGLCDKRKTFDVKQRSAFGKKSLWNRMASVEHYHSLPNEKQPNLQ